MSVRVGIYGGGQLGGYLCKAARRLGAQTTILTHAADSTAAAYADQVVVAHADAAHAAADLIAMSDIVTFELEDVPALVLRQLGQAATAGEVKVAPTVATLRLLQNKRTQKQWLVSQGFPTAPFIDCPEGSKTHDVAAHLGLPFIQKAHRGGYDGRGVQLVTAGMNDTALWTGNAFAEQFVAEKRELAVLAARSQTAR